MEGAEVRQRSRTVRFNIPPDARMCPHHGPPLVLRPGICRPRAPAVPPGATPANLASAFAVSLATLYRWLHAHPHFAAQVAIGKLEAEAVAEPTRYERATGYQVTVERVFTRNTGQPVIVRYKKHILANPKAALRWLRVRRRDRWTLGDKGQWPGGAPWQKPAKKKSVSQNARTIRKIMMVALVRMIQAGKLTRPELASLLQHLLSGLRAAAVKGDRHVSPQNTSNTDHPSEAPPLVTSPGLPVVNAKPDLIERAEPVSPPQPPLPRRQDQPQRPVPHRLRRVRADGTAAPLGCE